MLTGGDAGANLANFRVDDIATGIIAIEEDGSLRVTSGDIYSLDGRLMRSGAKSLDGLPKGIYMVDGKKYYVR